MNPAAAWEMDGQKEAVRRETSQEATVAVQGGGPWRVSTGQGAEDGKGQTGDSLEAGCTK